MVTATIPATSLQFSQYAECRRQDSADRDLFFTEVVPRTRGCIYGSEETFKGMATYILSSAAFTARNNVTLQSRDVKRNLFPYRLTTSELNNTNLTDVNRRLTVLTAN